MTSKGADNVPPILDSASAHHRHARARLENDLVAWLTTVAPSGRPATVPIWFLWDGEGLLIYSRPDMPKLRNLSHNPNVTVALDDTKGGDDVVRVDGTARHVETHPAAHEVPLYVEKYAEGIRRIGYDGPATFARDFSAAIVVTPTKLHAWS